MTDESFEDKPARGRLRTPRAPPGPPDGTRGFTTEYAERDDGPLQWVTTGALQVPNFTYPDVEAGDLFETVGRGGHRRPRRRASTPCW